MTFAEYASYDGLGLAELVKRGDLKPVELVETAIALAEKHNPALNVLVTRMYERARAAAQRPSGGPFEGVPMVLKDLLADCEGVPTTCGSRFLAGQVAAQDAELVRRYRRGGLIPIAKTNAPEFGIVPTTEPLAYGPTHNPWNLAHSVGGSSGGSAAAVAAGIVPIGHANDGGGSIRIPAACCGLVGLKPTRARNPLGPQLGDIMSGLVAEHVVTRSVRDSAAVLDCTAGPDVGDPYCAPPPERPFLDEVSREPGRLRIAFWNRSLGSEPLHPECVRSVERTAALCSELGHELTEARPPVEIAEFAPSFMAVWSSGLTATIDGLALLRGQAPAPEHFEPLTWALYQQGRQVSASRYQLALIAIQSISRRVARFLEEYDVWLAPTLGSPPLPLGTIDVRESNADRAFAPIIGYVPVTPLFNATGQPAISLPLHWSADGLPIGVHLAARFGGEGMLLSLAAQLERARPWRDRRPPIFG